MVTRWDKLRSATLDAPARAEVARLIRDERAREPVVVRAGTVVEFRRGGQLMCGYLAHTPRGPGYRVIGVDGRPRRLRRDKLVDLSRDLVPTYPPDDGLKSLRALDESRETAKLEVDLETLWHVVADTGAARAWSLEELLELHDTGQADATRRAGLLRALWQGDRFDRDGVAWRPRSGEAVDQSRQAARREATQEARLAELAAWLRRVADGGSTQPAPPDADAALALLEAAAVGEETAESSSLMQAAHLHGAGSAFDVLVRLGRWTPDENLELHRLGVPDAFPETVVDAARQTDTEAAVVGWPWRRRWGGGIYATAGGERAYRLRRRLWGRRDVVDIHLAVPALWVAESGAVDLEAAERGRTLNLVERDIPMLPAQILQACRLTTAAVRPALTITVGLDDDLLPCQVGVKRSRVRPRAGLDDGLGTPAMDRLADLATALRERRRAAGAWECLRPSPWMGLHDGQALPATETTAERIDTELRLLAAEALGSWCRDRGVAAIYAAREPATMDDVIGSEVDADAADAMAVRAFRLEGRAPHATLTVTPAGHAGLGLGLCAVGIDPMRHYVDLVMQRQVLAVVGVGTGPLPEATLERAMLETQAAREAARRVEASGQRYWSLKWLEQLGADEGVSVVVVEPRGPGYLALLDGGPAGTFVPASRGERVDVAPGQRLRLRIEQVSARRNILRLADPRPDPLTKAPDPDPPGRC